MSDPKIDAIIVGSGAGGGTAARVLTDRGWNVVVLEKGKPWHADDFLPFDELHFREHKTLIPKVDTDPMIYAGADDKQSQPSERWWEIEMVGGSTMVWDANFPRYADEDMAITQYLDIASIPNNNIVDMPDWPWSYDDMQPWDHFHMVLDLVGQTATMTITPGSDANVAAFTIFNALPMPCLSPYPMRAEFGARTGGAYSNEDIANVNIVYTP